jgi:DNA-binding MarR family transcriptional regulator
MPAQDELDRDLWLFHLAFRGLVRQPDEILARQGLSRIHNRLLFVIGRAGEISVGDIAQALAVSRQAIHGPMKQLRDLGLIVSQPHAHKRTIQLVRLTPRGARLELAVNEVQRRHLAKAFEALPPTAVRGWRRVMAALGELERQG